MTETEAFELVASVVRDVLDDDEIVLIPSSTAESTPGWDSIANVKIVVALEGKLRRTFTTQQIETLQTLGDFVRAVQSVGATSV